MKALSLVQPRASLFAIGALTTETRPFGSTYRGPVAIHTPLWMPTLHRNLCEVEPILSTLRAAGLNFLDLPRSQVVAVADLVDCRPIQREDPAPSELEDLANDWAPGRFVWRFENVRPLLPPLTAGGRQGLWEWTPPKYWDLRIKPAWPRPASAAPTGADR
ncbi:MAG TPA: hypothetical protein VJ735_09305 [Actinomycetes bacterium]|nr:hypothetical protein [Actinomycetes bacterium]